MLEIKDERLVDAEREKYLDVFCVGIIRNIWGRRFDFKRYEKGKTSPLFDFVNVSVEIQDEQDDSESYDPSREYKDVELHEFIERHKESGDENDRFRARVFYYSKFKFKNVRQFSKATQIPYQVCVRAFREFREKLIQNL